MRIARAALVLSLFAGIVLAQPLPSRATGTPPLAVIVLENHSYGSTDYGINGDTTRYIVGNPDAPYINDTLIPQGTLFSNYYATTHPSLPNYLHMVAGTAAGCLKDTTCPKDSVGVDNIFHLLGLERTPFASYVQSMPTNCGPTDTDVYPSDHNPEVYLTDLDATADPPYGCAITDQPFPTSWDDPLPPFSFIVPDRCHGMEGSASLGPCPKRTDALISAGDAWLSQTVPTLLSQGARVIVLFDEATGGDKTNGGGHVFALEAGPGISAGATDGTFLSHDGLLAGLERYFHVQPLLAGAATANPLPLPDTTTPPAPSVTAFTPDSGSAGDTVTVSGTNLANANSVTFNSTEAAFFALDDSTISATVPDHATTGPITVATPGGVAQSSTPFMVEGAPPPTAIAQHAIGQGPAKALPALAWPQPTTAGNLLTAVVQWTGSGTPVPPAGWGTAVKKNGLGIFYEENAPAMNGSIAFTGSSLGAWALDLIEWSGATSTGSFDRSAVASSGAATSTLASSGTTAATSQPMEIAVGAIRTLSKATMGSPSNGFALVDSALQSSNRLGVFSKIPTVVEPEGVSVPLSAAVKWRGAIATFRSS